MGDIAEMMLDGTLDEQTGEYIGKPCGYPRTFEKGYYNPIRIKETSEQKEVRRIRKELAILIQEKHKTCTTEKEKNKAVDDARQEINLKYGKEWRKN